MAKREIIVPPPLPQKIEKKKCPDNLLKIWKSCPNCGKRIFTDRDHCEKCGKSLQQT